MNKSTRTRSTPQNRIINLVLLSLLAVNSILFLTTTASAQSVVATSERPARTVASRRVFVRSKSLLVRGAVVEDKLLRRPEFKELNLVITRDAADADIILELRHDLLTMYVFTVVDVRTQTVIAGGKLSSLGGTMAGKVAKRFVQEMAKANMP